MPNQFWIILGTGIVLVLALDVLGAIASRKFQFNYTKLAIVSLIILLGISIWATKSINATAGITITGLLSLVDATLGWKLASKNNPNLGELEAEFTEELKDGGELKPTFVIYMVLFGLVIGWVGTLLA